MATTALAVYDDDQRFPALANDLEEVVDFIHENLDGQELTARDLPRLTVPSGNAVTYRWDVPTLEGSEALDEISGVIIFKARNRAWWPGKPEETGGNVPPSCSSADAITGIGKQWATIDNLDPDDGPPRQIPCKQCPHSQFGSAPDGRGQACKETLQVFLLQEGAGFLPTAVAIPPTSLQGVKKYLLSIANAGLRFDQVVTTLALDKTQNSGGTAYAVVVPRLGGRLSPELAAKAAAYGAALKPQLQAVAVEPAQLLDISAPVHSEATEVPTAAPAVDPIPRSAPAAAPAPAPAGGPPVAGPPPAAQAPPPAARPVSPPPAQPAAVPAADAQGTLDAA